MVVGEPQSGAAAVGYKEILFLPTRDLRMEKYTGIKLDSTSPGVAQITGVDAVEQMTDLPQVSTPSSTRTAASSTTSGPSHRSASEGARRFHSCHSRDSIRLHTRRDQPDRGIADGKGQWRNRPLKEASAASIAGQRVMMRTVKPGITERSVAGQMTAAWMENGCERASYAAIVGSGLNSTTLHYAENHRTIETATS